jgi:hypothetical protein
VGEAFRVTAFENPGLMIPDLIPLVQLSLNQDKLMLTLEERSGSIWVLDNVGSVANLSFETKKGPAKAGHFCQV